MELPKEYTNRELGLLIENLHDNMNEGFKGVYKRQDTTNGNVAENCKKITAINKWRWMITGGLILSNIVIVPILICLIAKLF